MILTIKKMSGSVYVISKDRRFHESWGDVVKLATYHWYDDLVSIASWCNNDLNEECLFEMD